MDEKLNKLFKDLWNDLDNATRCKFDLVDTQVMVELINAIKRFAPFNSAHEGFAVIHEEFDELKKEVWKNPAKYPDRNENMYNEAKQVAAMAMRFMIDMKDRDALTPKEKAPPVKTEPCDGQYIDFQGATRPCSSYEGCGYFGCPSKPY